MEQNIQSLTWWTLHGFQFFKLVEQSKEMASQQKEDLPSTSPRAAGFGEMVVNRYQKIREHAETYPYVWASYIVVYGGLGLWATYRWRKLRKTEDRVRVLQERLRKLVETEEGASSTKSVEKAPSSTEKTPR